MACVVTDAMPECKHEDCTIPAAYRVALISVGPITGQKKNHERVNLCHFHMNEAADKHQDSPNTFVRVSSI